MPLRVRTRHRPRLRDAYIYEAISQSAYASGGDASAWISNSGTLNIDAIANAKNSSDTNFATASATNYYAIAQSATAHGGGMQRRP